MIKEAYIAGEQAALEKVAINLAGARKAFDATVKPSLIRRSPTDKDAITSQLRKQVPELNQWDDMGKYQHHAKLLKEKVHQMPNFTKKQSGAAYLPSKKTRAGMGDTAENSYSNAMPQGGILMSKEVGKQLDPKSFRKLDPQNREMVNRTTGLHEGIEKRVSSDPRFQAVSRDTNQGLAYSGHASPEVLLRENNITSTMSPELQPARQFFKDMRTNSGEAADLAEAFPRFQYGDQRLSRHAIKRMTEILNRRARES